MNMLLDLVRERPLMTWSELEVAFEEKAGVAAHSMTLRRALRRAGVSRQKAEGKVEPSGEQQEKRYGYTAAHRKKAPEQR